MNIFVTANDEAESVMVTKYRETEPLTGGRTRQIFDIVNCPGLVMVREGFHIGDHFEPDEKFFVLQGERRRYDDAAAALLAWDETKAEQQLLDTLGHTLRRYHRGSTAPLWSGAEPVDKARWIGTARLFRDLANRMGLEIKPLQVPR